MISFIYIEVIAVINLHLGNIKKIQELFERISLREDNHKQAIHLIFRFSHEYFKCVFLEAKMS